ncbi:MAG: Cys-tRNA(Pro) deacylase [Coriobacteriales bacterium]|nr:Cys-tRNA(Pro) deacylase [Coriobacteriaceae bacterium]MDY2722355.1 Cys-tRNA(Pro) deacylase [Coriobacteriales bacterium]MDY5662127.1 Cys-tRNA(Pro) deacylase [Coriobacteriales bacterium]
MSKKKETKTNAMRILDAAGVDHQIHVFEADGTMTGVEIAQMLGEEPEHVFKTLVTIGKSKEHYVFMVPVAEELDLKKAAKAAGEKSIEMVKSRELFGLTGYVHGGCSPLGMKKFFTTFIDETCILFDTILFSGGRIGTQIEMSFDDLANVIDLTPVDLVV